MEPTFNFWDNMAKRYPRFNDASMCKDVNHILNWCQNKNVSFDGASILDIGAGTGTMAAPQLRWEIVKGHNSFVRKNLNGAVFSAEPGNLYNKHSYKYSGGWPGGQ